MTGQYSRLMLMGIKKKNKKKLYNGFLCSILAVKKLRLDHDSFSRLFQ